MKRERIVLEYDSFENEQQLPSESRELLEKASEGLRKAYAPYSKFHVAAAVRLANGMVITGTNQENAAYPSGLCAERVALFAAGAQHPGVKITALAVTAYPESRKEPEFPLSPCGDCRQVMAEYEHRYNHKIRLIMQGGHGTYIATECVAQLLPFLFTGDALK